MEPNNPIMDVFALQVTVLCKRFTTHLGCLTIGTENYEDYKTAYDTGPAVLLSLIPLSFVKEKLETKEKA